MPLAADEEIVLAFETSMASTTLNTAIVSVDSLLPGGGINTGISPLTDTDTAQVIVTSSISGRVIDDLGSGIAGVTVTLTGTDIDSNPVTATSTTAADGTYSFAGLIEGTYTVTETQPAGYADGGEVVGSAGGSLSDDQISAIVLGSGVTATGYDFDETSSSISGRVIDDLGDGIANVTVTLTGTDVNGDPVGAETTTAADGTYSFPGLIEGTYTVTETQPAGYRDGGEVAGSVGGTVTDDQVSTIVLGAGVDATGYDFDEFSLILVITGLDPQRGVGLAVMLMAAGLLVLAWVHDQRGRFAR